jgi:UDP-N-acetylmuramate--alanine ligase
VLAEFTGAHRRFDLAAEVNGIRLYDDYGHHPAEIAATLETARALVDGGRVLALFQPHLYSRTRHLARETAAALAEADVVAVTDVYAAREEPVEGVTGKLVVDALAELRPGMTIGWTPRVEDGARFLAARARPGDVVLTVGAGDIDRAALLVLEELE